MFSVRKINKRIHVVDGDEVVYSMPQFVRVNHRDDLQRLADEFNRHGGRDIRAIMDFEKRYSRA